MSQTEPPQIEIKFTDELKRNLRTLAKKYRHIRSDLQPVIEQLQAGNFVGDRIPKTQSVFYKVRIKNSDIQKGKSGGYRLNLSPARYNGNHLNDNLRKIPAGGYFCQTHSRNSPRVQ